MKELKDIIAAELFTLKKIREEIKKEGGIQRRCVYFNPDVYPPSEIYQDFYLEQNFLGNFAGFKEKLLT